MRHIMSANSVWGKITREWVTDQKQILQKNHANRSMFKAQKYGNNTAFFSAIISDYFNS